jgi:hypothetical protein
MNLILTILIIFTIIIILLYLYRSSCYINKMSNRNLEEYTKYPLINESKIPNVIYSYWHDNQLPSFVQKCVNSWKNHNPSYKIIILNKNNINEYIPFDIFKLKFAKTHQQIADFIRIYLIYEYGGFWLDSTIYLNKSLDWVHSYQINENSEFVGFKINRLNGYESPLNSPIVENWFLASIPKSQFMLDWKNVFYSMNDYNTIDDYVNFIKSTTNINSIILHHYLTMHIACQYILQNSKYKYKLSLLDAEKGPFLYLCSINWDNIYLIPILLYFRGTECPLIKYRGQERKLIDTLLLSSLFK